MSIGLIVPTYRQEIFTEWLDKWHEEFSRIDVDHGLTLYICEDGPKKTIKVPKDYPITVHHYCWKDIDKDLGKDSWIIPRKCDGVRSYGFLKAYHNNHQYLWTLDDDCFPNSSSKWDGSSKTIADHYLEAFHSRYSINPYYNTLDLVLPSQGMSYDEQELLKHARGVPFKYRFKHYPVIQYGLWEGVSDYDAITQSYLTDITGSPLPISHAMPADQATTGCIMNAMWRWDWTPVMYQLLMGEVKGKKLKYNRSGDIWSGLLAKKVCDILHKPMVNNGCASIIHERASNVVNNLKNEADCIAPNDIMWEWLKLGDTALILNRHVSLKEITIEEAYEHYAHVMCSNPNLDPEYGRLLHKAVDTWLKLIGGKK